MVRGRCCTRESYLRDMIVEREGMERETFETLREMEQEELWNQVTFD